jgi:branched-chain amino acid aminotransferase
MIIYLNDKYISDEIYATVVPMFDGGIFETMRVYNHKIFKLSEHISRLFMSAKFLSIHIPYAYDTIKDICLQVLEKSRLTHGVVRISISLQQDILVIVRELPVYPEMLYQQGVKIITTSIVRQPCLPQVKSSNFLTGIIAKAEICKDNNSPFEILFLNHQGYVTECTVSNIFIIKDDTVITPPAYLGLLKGITRDVVLNIANNVGLHTKQIPFTRYDVFTADEIFITNSVIEILPVCNVDSRDIGKTKGIGRITTKLLELYRANAYA